MNEAPQGRGSSMLERMQHVEPSLIRDLHGRKRPGDIDLGLGEPVLRPDPAPFQRAVDWIGRHGCPYTPTPGLAGLRERVASHTGAQASQVLITHGSQEAIYLGLRTLVDPQGEEVLLVEPAYPAYAKICQMEGIPWRTVSLDERDGFAPRAAPVLEALTPRVRLVVISTPCNPSGRIWPRTELEALVAGLGDRWLLSDEVYRELYHGDEAPASPLGMHDRCIVAGGLSKSHAVTGLRVGWAVGPPAALAGLTRIHQLMTTSASTLSQRVALEILSEPEGMGQHRAVYRDRRGLLVEALRRGGLEHVVPEGAFYCLVRIPESVGTGSLETALDLLGSQRVVTIPGIAFGQALDRWLRLTWAGEPETVAEGIRRVAAGFDMSRHLG